jgi:uroporphyrinogen-III synthase
MSCPLQGKRIALAEGRQLEELAAMLEAEGAIALRYPLLSILDAPDAVPVLEWIRRAIADRFASVVFFTGEGVRRLLHFAETDGLRESFIAALARSRLITRGPKPVKALKEVGLVPHRVAEAPTTDGVIAALRQEPIAGTTVGVQFYSESNPPLMDFLAAAGATADAVLPYVYAPAADAGRVVELIDHLAGGDVDVIVFTSSPQVTRLFEVAADRGKEATLAEGLRRTCVAAVGPVLADALHERGVRVDVCPTQGFVMKNLVLQIKRHVENAEGRMGHG